MEEIYTILHLEVPGEAVPTQRIRMRPGNTHSVPIRVYGLTIPLLVSADIYATRVADPGDCLRDATGVDRKLVVVPISYEYCRIPSDRPLWQIFAEAVQHGVDFPTHGSDCVCMDNFAREMRVHMRRAAPELRSRVVEDDDGEMEIDTDPESEKVYHAAMARMHVLLSYLVRAG